MKTPKSGGDSLKWGHSMDKFESTITRSSSSAEALYNRLSSLEGLSLLPANERIERIEASQDHCSIAIKGYGTIEVQVLDREPFKTIKFGDVNGRPIPFFAWIQLKEIAPGDTRIRLTLHAKLPLMIRMLAKAKIQEGLNRAAEQIARLSV